MDELGDLAFGIDDGGADLGSLLEQLASYSNEYNESGDVDDPAAAADDILREHEASQTPPTSAPQQQAQVEEGWRQIRPPQTTPQPQQQQQQQPQQQQVEKSKEDDLHEITAHASSLVSQVQSAGRVDETRIKELLSTLGLSYTKDKIDQISQLLTTPTESAPSTQQPVSTMSSTQQPVATTPSTVRTSTPTQMYSTPPPGYTMPPARIATVHLSAPVKTTPPVAPAPIPFPPPFLHQVPPPGVVHPGYPPSTWQHAAPAAQPVPQPVPPTQPMPPGVPTAPAAATYSTSRDINEWDEATRRFEEQLKSKDSSASHSKSARSKKKTEKERRDSNSKNRKRRYSSSSHSSRSSSADSSSGSSHDKRRSKSHAKRKPSPAPRKKVKESTRKDAKEKETNRRPEREKVIEVKKVVKKPKEKTSPKDIIEVKEVKKPEKEVVRKKEHAEQIFEDTEKEIEKAIKKKTKKSEEVSPQEKGKEKERRLNDDVVEIVVKIDNTETLIEKPVESSEQKKKREQMAAEIAELEQRQADIDRNQNTLSAQMEEVKRRKETNRRRSQMLEEQLARLKGEHEEMTRRGPKGRNPLVKKNVDLQGEVAKQLEQTRKFTIEMNKALDSAGVRQINQENDLKTIRRHIYQLRTAIQTIENSYRQGSRKVEEHTKKASRERESPRLKVSRERESQVSRERESPRRREEKRREEPREREEKIEKPHKKIVTPRYQYYDAGCHWCSKCNVTTASVIDMLDHIHSNDHRAKLDMYDRPWMDEINKNGAPTGVAGSAQVEVIPLKGVEFMMPCSAFFCRICNKYAGDTICGEGHLKSEEHNTNYRMHVEKNPDYEKRLLLEKAAVLSSRALQNQANEMKKTPPAPPAKPTNADDLRNVISESTSIRKEMEKEKNASQSQERHEKKQKKKFTDDKQSINALTKPRMIKNDGSSIKIQLSNTTAVKKTVSNEKAKPRERERSRSRSRSRERSRSRSRSRRRDSSRSRSHSSDRSSRDSRHHERRHSSQKRIDDRYIDHKNKHHKPQPQPSHQRTISHQLVMKGPMRGFIRGKRGGAVGGTTKYYNTTDMIKSAAARITDQLNKKEHENAGSSQKAHPSQVQVTEAMKRQLMGKASKQDMDLIKSYQDFVKMQNEGGINEKGSVKSRLGVRKHDGDDEFTLELNDVSDEDVAKPLVRY